MSTSSKTTKKIQSGINPASRPSGTGCVECLATGSWWLHLRRCAECGHIGCCDTSPQQHAAKHAALTGHSVVQSFEPLQHWFYNYEKQKIVKGLRLLPPYSHPAMQPVPGPEGRVPINWEALLHGMEELQDDQSVHLQESKEKQTSQNATAGS